MSFNPSTYQRSLRFLDNRNLGEMGLKVKMADPVKCRGRARKHSIGMIGFIFGSRMLPFADGERFRSALLSPGPHSAV